MKKFHDLPVESQKKILDFAQKEAGAPAVIVIMADSIVPCSTVTAGLGCIGDHETHVVVRGIDPRFLFSVLLDEAVSAGKRLNIPKEEMVHTLEYMIDNDDSEPHKIS